MREHVAQNVRLSPTKEADRGGGGEKIVGGGGGGGEGRLLCLVRLKQRRALLS